MKKVVLFCIFSLIFCTILIAQIPEWIWANQAGGTGTDTGYSISVDADGNTYIIGAFRYTANFGTIALVCTGSYETFIAKLDVDGNWLWAIQVYGTVSESNYGYGISTDTNGNSYITGFFQSTATFGPFMLNSSGGEDIFVAKIDTNGNWQWAKKAGGSLNNIGKDIVIDELGNSYITGLFMGSATFGNITISSNGITDIYVAKLDSNGNWLWASQAGGLNQDRGLSIDLDDNENVCIAGYFREISYFGPTTLTSSGYEDIFIAKLNNEGNWLWSKQAGGSGVDTGFGINMDTSGNSIVIGNFQSTATFGDTTLISDGGYDIFVTKLDENGNYLWAKKAGGDGADQGFGVKVDLFGNSYITGSFDNDATFGDSTLISNGSYDIFVSKLDTYGNWLWVKQAGGSGIEGANSICLDTYENSYITGRFVYTVPFGSTTLITNGIPDIFVAKLSGSLYANFEADVTSGLVPLEVNFTDLSVPIQNPITNWQWDFENDGIIDSYLQNPTFTYTQSGIYSVALTVNDGTQEDTEIKEDYITVIEPLDADFEADVTSGDAPLEVQFTDLSTGQILGWMWDFDNDGTIDSNEQNPIYTYNDAGVYTVALTITDGSNEDTEIKEDYITVISTGVQNEIIPLETLLYQNHPNPFNPVTNIRFDIKENETGVLYIFNLKGQIIESQRLNSGKHDYLWNAENNSSGVYFYKLQTGSFVELKKMLLLK